MSAAKDVYVFDPDTMQAVNAVKEMGRGAMQRRIAGLERLLEQVETVLGMEAQSYDRAREAARLIAQARKLGAL